MCACASKGVLKRPTCGFCVEVRPGGDNHPEDQEGEMYLELSGKLWKFFFFFVLFFFFETVLTM